MLPFNKPSITDKEKQYIIEALHSDKLCGDGRFSKRVHRWFADNLGIAHPLLTTSCTHALEMSAMLAGLKAGDEVIAPSFTFVSTVNAFMLRGARPVFADIRPDTLNIDESLIEDLITPKTRAIIPVHYAGVSCEMDTICSLAKKYKLFVIEDAAQGVGSSYKGRPLGTIGDFGCYSFHETKNYTSGEGGLLCVNREEYMPKAEMIREKGTDRTRFLRGEADKYTWREIGSSYLPSDIVAALLCAQLERFDEIMEKRMAVWNTYHSCLERLEKEGFLRRPIIPGYAAHNAHMYYIILPCGKIRDRLMKRLKDMGISAVFHYIPLHSSPVGMSLGYKDGDLPVTEDLSARLLRLPLFADMGIGEAMRVSDAIEKILTN